ncbi:MAG TPA: phosphodiester glycosidase family protein [Dokdonella sp.]
MDRALIRSVAAAAACAATLALALSPRAAAALQTRLVRAGDADVRVVELDLERDRLEAHWRDADGTPFASIDALKQWGAAHGRTLRFATNAGIYDRAFQPLGLYVEDGRTLRPLNTVKGIARSGNFSLQPNGVFYVDRAGRAGVVTTDAWRTRAIDARLATQSGPMLVVDGEINPAFDADSDSLKWRSGVCARTPRTAVFAVSLAPVTFHAFARAFRDELGCRDALYLDGTLSRIYTDAHGYSGAPEIMVRPYAAMLAVFSADAAD